ncbi:MAG TPA: hypothetical protein PLZ62_04200 [bacterium]|nr:hypothetical protein [bacterium]
MNAKLANIFFLPVLILSLCSCGQNDYTVTQISLSDHRDEKTSLITNPLTTYPSNTPIIYGQAKFTTPKDGTQTYIQINFSMLDEDGDKEIIDSDTKNTKQSGTMIFEGRRPGLSWPVGNYSVDFVIEDKTYASQTFEVVSSETSVYTEKSNWINSIQTCKSVDSAHNPINTTSVFAPTDKEIYLTLEFNDKVTKNSEVKVEWVYLDNIEKFTSQVQTISKNQKIHFVIDKTYNANFLQTNGDWQHGSYQANIYIDNVLVKTIAYQIN